MAFINQQDFDDPQMWLRAEGADLSEERAVVSTNGTVLFYARTGGMLRPRRRELSEGTVLFRLGGSDATVEALMAGSWWVERAEFGKLLAFARSHDLGIGMAMRVLCLVPPQWSDMGRLIRVTVARPLLAMRGLGESVRTPAGDPHGDVRMEHRNDNPARRLHQLFIPGLRRAGLARRALRYGQVFDLDPAEGTRGWLYL